MAQCHKAILRNELFAKCADSEYSDVSIVIDASGSTGTVFHPHFTAHSKNEQQRHNLLKVHCMFTKIHGFGVCIYRGLANLEPTNGANFGLECLYRTIIFYLKEKRRKNPKHMIRNLYVQMDNARGKRPIMFFCRRNWLGNWLFVNHQEINAGQLTGALPLFWHTG